MLVKLFLSNHMISPQTFHRIPRVSSLSDDENWTQEQLNLTNFDVLDER